jgi:hypothetical protein
LNVPMLFECASLGEWAGLGKCAGCVWIPWHSL